MLRVQLAYPVDERRDRLLGFGDQFLHAPVSHHEVGGTGVFVDQQNLGTDFKGFDDVRRLRRRARGVVTTELGGRLAIREIGNKWRNRHLFHPPSILSANRHCRGIRCHPFPAIAGDMIVNAANERLEQRRFAVISPTHDQRDPTGNAGAAHAARMRQIKRHRQRIWRLPAYEMLCLHGAVVVAGAPWQAGIIRHEGHELPVLQHLTQRGLVFYGVHVVFDIRAWQGAVTQTSIPNAWQGFAQQRRGLPSQHRAAPSREADGEARLDMRRRQHHAGAGQHFLPWHINANLATAATALPARLGLLNSAVKGPG